MRTSAAVLALIGAAALAPLGADAAAPVQVELQGGQWSPGGRELVRVRAADRPVAAVLAAVQRATGVTIDAVPADVAAAPVTIDTGPLPLDRVVRQLVRPHGLAAIYDRAGRLTRLVVVPTGAQTPRERAAHAAARGAEAGLAPAGADGGAPGVDGADAGREPLRARARARAEASGPRRLPGEARQGAEAGFTPAGADAGREPLMDARVGGAWWRLEDIGPEASPDRREAALLALGGALDDPAAVALLEAAADGRAGLAADDPARRLARRILAVRPGSDEEESTEPPAERGET